MSASPVTEVEAKTIHEVLKVAQTKSASDNLDKLLEKRKSWRALHVGTWIVRFVKNARVNQWLRVLLLLKRLRVKECFGSSELSNRQDQQRTTRDTWYIWMSKPIKMHGVLECRGRIQGSYSIYLDDTTTYTRKLVERSHLDTLHGGVTLT